MIFNPSENIFTTFFALIVFFKKRQKKMKFSDELEQFFENHHFLIKKVFFPPNSFQLKKFSKNRMHLIFFPVKAETSYFSKKAVNM